MFSMIFLLLQIRLYCIWGGTTRIERDQKASACNKLKPLLVVISELNNIRTPGFDIDLSNEATKAFSYYSLYYLKRIRNHFF